MSQIFDRVLDARGLNCPMPLVNARKEIGKLEPGQILKILSTDRGSVADFQGWAKVAKNIELVAQETETLEGASVYVHFVKRAS
jgi:TusA-related sulfurtransferase